MLVDPVDQEGEEKVTQRSRVISKVLSPAIRLWLRSQVDSIETLDFQIEGGDRQILSGHIPTVKVAAQKAVYQGFHISHIQLAASHIRVNLGQMLKGKPFRLLAVVPVVGEAVLHQADLTASLHQPDLAQGLAELLVSMVRNQMHLPAALLPASTDGLTLTAPQVHIHPNQLLLQGAIASSHTPPVPFAFRTGLRALGSCLQLESPYWQTDAGEIYLDQLHGYEVELGRDIEIQELTLDQEQVICRGQIKVIPVDP